MGDFQIMYDNKTNEGEQVFIRRSGITIKWPGGRTGPPRDSPECGFHGELCIKPIGEGNVSIQAPIIPFNYIFGKASPTIIRIEAKLERFVCSHHSQEVPNRISHPMLQ